MKVYLYIFFIFLFSGFSCQLIKNTASKAEAISRCKFDLVQVKKKVSFTEHTSNLWNYVIELDIACRNPSNETIILGGCQLDLFANSKWIGDVQTPIPISLKSNTITNIKAKTIISPSGVFGILFKKFLGEEITYTLSGTFNLKLGDFTFPLKVELLKVVDHNNQK